MIRAGENSGQLEKILDNLTASLEKEEEIRKKIKSALIYPALLLITAIVMLAVLVIFAIPKITKMFVSGGIKPPLFTRIVMASSNFLLENGSYLLIIISAAIISAFWLYKKNKTTEIFFKRMVQKLPLIKDIIFKRSLERLCANLSNLLSAGMPIIDSLEITSETVGHPEIKSAILRIARERTKQGLTLGESFRREPIFPQTLISLINISEKGGHTADLLKTLGEFYASEIDSSIKNALTLLEPILLFIMAFIVGGIALSVIVPIYQMIEQI